MLDITSIDIKELFGTVAMIATSLGIFFEVAPIKVNPISWILKYMARIMNEDVHKEIAELRKDLTKLDNKVDKNEIDRIRWEILDFSNSCRNGRKHTKEEFDHIIDLNKKYHVILDARDEENGQIDAAYDYLIDLYQYNMKHNNFLCSNGIDDDC